MAGPEAFEGNKDRYFFSDLAPYPDCELADDMHANDEGCCKQFLTLWFSSINNKYCFYLLNRIHQINKLLLRVKYPRLIKNSQKPFLSYFYWSAHEYRTFFFVDNNLCIKKIHV